MDSRVMLVEDSDAVRATLRVTVRQGAIFVAKSSGPAGVVSALNAP